MALIAEFRINRLPLMTNRLSGKHWGVRHSERAAWQRLISAECLRAKIIDLRLNSAALTLIRHSFKAPDPDGLVSGFKPIIDSLVKCGVIIDDNYKIIGMPNYGWVYSPKRQGGFVSIKIEDKK